MNAIADGLLIAGAVGVAFYCFVLSRRLTRFTDLDKGVGGAVALLYGQVEDLKSALDRARSAAELSGESLQTLTERADSVARRLELQVISLQDVTDPVSQSTPRKPRSTYSPAKPISASPKTQSFFSRQPAGEIL